MRRRGNWYNGSKRNKKYKDAKIHNKGWIPLHVTQSEYVRIYTGDVVPSQGVGTAHCFRFVIDNAKYSKPKHEERFANINDCFPLRAIGHHTH